MRKLFTFSIKPTGKTTKRVRHGLVYLGVRFSNNHNLIIYAIEDTRMQSFEELTYIVKSSGDGVDDVLSKRNNGFIEIGTI